VDPVVVQAVPLLLDTMVVPPLRPALETMAEMAALLEEVFLLLQAWVAVALVAVAVVAAAVVAATVAVAVAVGATIPVMVMAVAVAVAVAQYV